MKQVIWVCTLFCGVGLVSVGARAAEWSDLNVLQINRGKPRATMMVYPDAQSAMQYDRTRSPWFKSLNGDWKFNWVKSPSDRPADFHKPSSDVSGWGTIPVPSNWEIEGHGMPWYNNAK